MCDDFTVPLGVVGVSCTINEGKVHGLQLGDQCTLKCGDNYIPKHNVDNSNVPLKCVKEGSQDSPMEIEIQCGKNHSKV